MKKESTTVAETQAVAPATETVALPEGVRQVLAETQAVINAQNGRRIEATSMFLSGLLSARGVDPARARWRIEPGDAAMCLEIDPE